MEKFEDLPELNATTGEVICESCRRAPRSDDRWAANWIRADSAFARTRNGSVDRVCCRLLL